MNRYFTLALICALPLLIAARGGGGHAGGHVGGHAGYGRAGEGRVLQRTPALSRAYARGYARGGYAGYGGYGGYYGGAGGYYYPEDPYYYYNPQDPYQPAP